MIKGSYKEHETLETGRILAAAIMDIFISAHDAFKFLESYNARSTLYMRHTLTPKTLTLIDKHIKQDELKSFIIRNARVDHLIYY